MTLSPSWPQVDPVSRHPEGLNRIVRDGPCGRARRMKAVLREDVGVRFALVVAPVVAQLLGHENKHVLLRKLVIFHDGRQ